MLSISRRDLAVAIMGAAVMPAAQGTPKSGMKPDSAIKSSNAASRVRSALTERLEGQFQDFLRRASVGDLYLMSNVLTLHDGNSIGIHAQSPELALPTAFEEEIDNGVPCFIAVPEHLQEDAERYVQMLIAEDGRS
jgi:hypothetical protein